MGRHILPVLLLVFISFALYTNTLNNGFVYDDKGTIVSNAGISRLDNIKKLFNTEYFAISGEMTYRPVVTFTYILDYALFGLKPLGFHLMNVLLHAFNGVVLYIFLSLLSGPLKFSHSKFNVPFLTSLLFMTHPALTEAVNAVSFREDLLVCLFYITALSLYIRARSLSATKDVKAHYIFSYLSYSFALLSKEMAATLPLIVCCYEWAYVAKKKQGASDSGQFNLYILGYFAVTLLYLYLRFFYFYNIAESMIDKFDFKDRVLTLPWLLSNYIKITLFPVSLSAYYAIAPVKSIDSALFFYPIIIIFLLFVIALPFTIKDKNIIAGIIFFLIVLIPVYNIVPIGVPFAERYLYLPTVGFSMFMGIIIHSFLNNKAASSYRIAWLSIIFFIVISINSLLVVKRNMVWQNDFSLWYDVVKKMPNSAFAHNNIGLAYAEDSQFDAAITHFQKAVQLQPNYLYPYSNLGFVYSQQSRFDEAVKVYKYVLTENPYDPIVHSNLGVVYRKQKQFDKAIQEFKTAIQLNPIDYVSHYNVGLVYADQGLYDEAMHEYETALKLKPDYLEAQINIKIVNHLKRNRD